MVLGEGGSFNFFLFFLFFELWGKKLHLYCDRRGPRGLRGLHELRGSWFVFQMRGSHGMEGTILDELREGLIVCWQRKPNHTTTYVCSNFFDLRQWVYQIFWKKRLNQYNILWVTNLTFLERNKKKITMSYLQTWWSSSLREIPINNSCKLQKVFINAINNGMTFFCPAPTFPQKPSYSKKYGKTNRLLLLINYASIGQIRRLRNLCQVHQFAGALAHRVE